MIPYAPPTFQEEAFNCPHCNAFSMQNWNRFVLRTSVFSDLYIAHCTHCNEYTLWHKGRMIVPDAATAPMPNDDLCEDAKQDFLEARRIVDRSPRGAAALLRLCLQKLCGHLREDPDNLNNAIAALVRKGLPVAIQQALDFVRVIGNNAVHPGEINLKDNQDTATRLFELINFVVEDRITKPKQVDAMYATLPTTAREQIDKRDNKS